MMMTTTRLTGSVAAAVSWMFIGTGCQPGNPPTPRDVELVVEDMAPVAVDFEGRFQVPVPDGEPLWVAADRKSDRIISLTVEREEPIDLVIDGDPIAKLGPKAFLVAAKSVVRNCDTTVLPEGYDLDTGKWAVFSYNYKSFKADEDTPQHLEIRLVRRDHEIKVGGVDLPCKGTGRLIITYKKTGPKTYQRSATLDGTKITLHSVRGDDPIEDTWPASFVEWRGSTGSWNARFYIHWGPNVDYVEITEIKKC